MSPTADGHRADALNTIARADRWGHPPVTPRLTPQEIIRQWHGRCDGSQCGTALRKTNLRTSAPLPARNRNTNGARHACSQSFSRLPFLLTAGLAPVFAVACTSRSRRPRPTRFVDSTGVNLSTSISTNTLPESVSAHKEPADRAGSAACARWPDDPTTAAALSPSKPQRAGSGRHQGHFITGPTDTVELLAQYPGRMSNAFFEAYEGLNGDTTSRTIPTPGHHAEGVHGPARGAMKSDPRAVPVPDFFAPALSEPELPARRARARRQRQLPTSSPCTTTSPAAIRGRRRGGAAGGYGSIAAGISITQVRHGRAASRSITTETGYQDGTPAITDAVLRDII